MVNSDNTSGFDPSSEDIRARIQKDYQRVTNTDDPWRVLELPQGADPEVVNARYEELDQLYRTERLENLDDNDLTRKALEIRRLISRAIVEIQSWQQSEAYASGSLGESSSVVSTVDPDSAAMADIYFRDGISWFKLDDLDSAIDSFQNSMDHDPSQGVTLAYHAYARYQRSPDDEEEIRDCRESFRTAASIDPGNPEIYVLQARFALQDRSLSLARESIRTVRDLDPTNPDLGELRRIYDEIRLKTH